MHGIHLTAELHDCAGQASRALMTEPQALRALCRRVVAAAGLTPVGELFHHFAPGGGITGVVLLAESHLAVHTWPELAAVTLDVYVCNVHADNSGRAEQVVEELEAAFAPQRCQRQRLLRALPAAVAPALRAAAVPASAAHVFSALDLEQARAGSALPRSPR